MEREKRQILGTVSVSSGHPEQGMETTAVAPGPGQRMKDGWTVRQPHSLRPARHYGSAAASEPELVPRLLPSPLNGFQARLCCHGNTCPIILLAENHSSANLAGTYSFSTEQNCLLFLYLCHDQIFERRSGEAVQGIQATREMVFWAEKAEGTREKQAL